MVITDDSTRQTILTIYKREQTAPAAPVPDNLGKKLDPTSFFWEVELGNTALPQWTSHQSSAFKLYSNLLTYTRS